MSTKKGYIFGVVITLFASAIVIVVWGTLARTTTVGHSFAIMGAFLLSSSLALSVFGAYLPKDDIRHGALMLGAIPGALAGMGCLFFGVAPAEVQQTQDWAPMFLGLASFISFQILLVYLFLRVRRRQT